MRRAVRYLFVMVAITGMGALGSGARSVASVPVPQPVPAVAAVLPASGAVVGVAHPVVVKITPPVSDRIPDERPIRIT